MRHHLDGRAERWCDVFEFLYGDVNVFELYAGRPSGWHRHQYQTDKFFVAEGEVVVGWWSEDHPPVYLHLHRGARLTIRPNTWHGYEAPNGAVLVMYLDQKYNPDDEETKPFSEVPWSPT